MRDDEYGLHEFGGEYMYKALIHWLRCNHPETLQNWEVGVNMAIEYMEPKRLEPKGLEE